ncbi:glycosyltransferase [Pedobacter sp. Leaf170]|uniref:glycosyltransferase n=1 Tax=Pedobacter sp. Leaf170 TaxID=2876558 RepID=UPI001E348422|nr:glycosyltransferase [Pedobacter sp. Leaf170]
MVNSNNRIKKLVIITACLDDWGGSEELWAKSIPHFKSNGVDNVILYKNRVNKQHPQFKNLIKEGLQIREFDGKLKRLKSITAKVGHVIGRIADKLGIAEFSWNKSAKNISNFLAKDSPDFAIISQGINFDGLSFAYECLKQNIPYIIVAHKAVEFYWPSQGDRNYMKQTLLKAKKCLFVSKHNLKITEEQFGVRLPNSEIILNPVKTEVNPLPYPTNNEIIKLACVGRLFVIDKGQDILLRILNSPKWRERNLSITFLGKGPDEQGLKDMAELFGLRNIYFKGYTDDIREIWKEHHALILPSRSEGLPLTIIEAMSFGRPTIASNAGGNAEIIQDGITGFIGEGDEYSFDLAMEKAWQRSSEWEDIGRKAAEYIKQVLPPNPEKIFADLVLKSLKTD